MNETREALIGRLAADIPAGRLHFSRLVVAWLGLGMLIATSLLVIAAPFRPGFMAQLTVPRFTLEMTLGVVAIVGLVVATLKLAVPGSVRAVHFVLALVLTLCWLSSIVLSLFYPALELGTLGMRALCWLETLAYGFPIMLLGFWLLSRGYVINWIRAGFLAGLVSGFMPGLLMQIACMYQAQHALVAHIGPAFLLAMVGGGVGAILMKTKARR